MVSAGMAAVFILLAGCLAHVLSQSPGQPVQVQESGIEDVAKFATAIRFHIDLVNTGETPYEVTVTPRECCLEIAKNDTDCGVIQLRPPRTLLLGAEDTYSNKTGTAVFLFRNLYARYRMGQCSFIISTEGAVPIEWIHTLHFNTFPNDTDTVECPGVDQDPDRSCSPVDCAIKYKGSRNFYRISTGRCEPVAPCNTRGGVDGATITAYYDEDTNQCHSLQLNLSDNALYQIESDTAIPAELDPLIASVESQIVQDNEELGDDISSLDCNHGVQEGPYCECDEGWTSSGLDLHHNYNWCDVRKMDGVRVDTGPRVLSFWQETAAVVTLLSLNLLLAVGWMLLLFCISCRDKCPLTRRRKKELKGHL